MLGSSRRGREQGGCISTHRILPFPFMVLHVILAIWRPNSVDTVERGVCLTIRSFRNWDQCTLVRCLQGFLILNTEMKTPRTVGSHLPSAISPTQSSSTNSCSQLWCLLTLCHAKELIQLVKEIFAGAFPSFCPSWSHRGAVAAEDEAGRGAGALQQSDQDGGRAQQRRMRGWEGQGQPGGQSREPRDTQNQGIPVWGALHQQRRAKYSRQGQEMVEIKITKVRELPWW